MAKSLDLEGQRFGKLLVVSRAENNSKGNTRWLCKCDCGSEKVALGYDLTHGRTVSCGCRLKGTISYKREDLTGQNFGRLTVIDVAETVGGKIKWNCKCSCGKTVVVTSANLKNGHTQSCGCIRIKHQPKENLVGQKFGKLSVKGLSRYEKGRFYWECECECGNKKIVCGTYLKAGKVKSCGCLYEEDIKIGHVQHGDSKKDAKYHRVYTEWQAMLSRCSSSYHGHHRYYDRGISVCEEWHDYRLFKQWAITSGYQDNLTLDRKNNDGNYEPSNCRWATKKEQANNTSKNVFITYKGRTQTMKQWCDELNINYGTVKARYRKKWDIDRLFAPICRGK